MSNLLTGEVFAGFRVEEILGRGGMGWVYRVHDLALDRERALKVLDPALAQDDAFRQRFQRESQMAAKIEHPAVVPVYQAGEEDGRLFIVMRLIRGPDLQNLVDREGPLDRRRTAKIVTAVAGGLDAAHKNGIVHRDVKPANVLLELGAEGERVYLTDFGIGRPSDAAGAGLTSTGEVIGTADYIAPEQIRGARADARSDIYTLGCVASFLLTGEPPFARENQLATLYAHANAERPRPTLLEPGLPEGIDDVIVRATAIEPAERYASAGEFGAALTQALGPSSRGTAPIPAPTTAPTPPTSGTSSGSDALGDAETTQLTPSSTQQPSSSSRRPFNPLIALGAVALVAAAAAAFLILGGGGDEGDGGGGGGGDVVQIEDLPAFETFDVTGGEPASGLVAGKNNILVLSAEDSSIFRFDPEERKTVEGGPDTAVQEPSAAAIGFESVWVTSATGDTVVRFPSDPAADPEPIAVGAGPVDVAVDKAVWVANGEDNSVSRVDPEGGSAGPPLELDSPPSQIAAGEGGVWVVSAEGETVSQISLDGSEVVEQETSPGAVDLAVAEEKLFVASERGEVVTRSFELSTIGQPIPLDGTPVALAAGDASIWVALREPNRVVEIDAGSRTATGAGQLEGTPTGISVAPEESPDPGSVWVSLEDGSLARVGP